MTYPRVYISDKVKLRIKKIAKKLGKTEKELGDKIVLAGIKALGL